MEAVSRKTIRRLLITLILTGAASGCGDDKPYHGGVYIGANLPPQAGNVQFSPTTFSKGEGGGAAVITGFVDFCDLDGDVVTLRTTTQDPNTKRTNLVTDHDVRGLARPLTGSAAFCTLVQDLPGAAKDAVVGGGASFVGTLPFSLLISTTLTGDRQFLIVVRDSAGQTSNVVIGRFSVPQ